MVPAATVFSVSSVLEDEYDVLLQVLKQTEADCQQQTRRFVPLSCDREHYLGRGAYGMVWKAWDSYQHCFVAIKIIRPSLFSTKDDRQRALYVKRLLRERRLFRYLHQRQLCSSVLFVPELYETIPSSVSSRPSDGMVMEYFDQSLYPFLSHTRNMSLRRILSVMYQLTLCLWHIHAAGIVHRDIKPDNCLMRFRKSSSHNTSEDRRQTMSEIDAIRIGDFGLARFVSPTNNDADKENNKEQDLEFMTSYVTSRPYRSPEILMGATDYSYKADIWSLGCLFVEMWNDGFHAFAGKDTDEQFISILEFTGLPTKPDDLLPSLHEKEILTRIFKQLSTKPRFVHTPKPISRLLTSSPLLIDRMPLHVQDLLQWMLTFSHDKRPSAEQVLRHRSFQVFFDETHIQQPICIAPPCSLETTTIEEEEEETTTKSSLSKEEDDFSSSSSSSTSSTSSLAVLVGSHVVGRSLLV